MEKNMELNFVIYLVGFNPIANSILIQLLWLERKLGIFNLGLIKSQHYFLIWNKMQCPTTSNFTAICSVFFNV